MKFENVKTIKQMADDVIENRLFDDEFEEGGEK